MDLLAPNTTEEARRVFCIYPISGTYTKFQRDLFYLTTALALLGHAHEWLTAGCLAFAVSYSSTAAIHSLALAFQGDCHRDADMLAVDIIVWWAMWASLLCSLFYPLLLYRKLALLSRTWNCLVVTAHLALLFNGPRLMSQMTSSLVLSRLDENGQWSDPCAGMEAHTLFRGSDDRMSSVVWGKIDINNTSLPHLSGADDAIIAKPINLSAAEIFAYLITEWLKNSLFITPSILAIFLDRRVARSAVFVRLLAKRVLHTPSKRKRCRLLFETAIVRILQLSWLLVQCFPILVLFEIAACIICHCLNRRKLRLQDISHLEPQLSKRRFQAAKHAAVLLYVVITLGYVTWIPLIASFAALEASDFMTKIPESETFRSVGQWSPWLALFLAIAAATTSRLLGGDEMPTVKSWFHQHRLVVSYIQARDWLANEWDETKKWWKFPEKQAIDSLNSAEQEDEADKKFAATMIKALGDFTDRTGFILPLPVPMQLFGLNRGEGDLPKYLINEVDLNGAGKITTEDEKRDKRV